MTASSATAQLADQARRRRIDPRKVTGLLLISPWLIGLLLFKLLPILASLGISFTGFHMLTPGETCFVGLDNDVRLLHDEAVGYVAVLSQAELAGPAAGLR